MTENSLPIDKKAFFLAFGVLSLLMAIYTVGTLGLFVGIPISAWQLPLAVLLTLAAGWRFTRRLLHWKTQLNLALLLLGILLLSGILAALILDTSWDGQWYHLPAIVRLGKGWNPIRDPFYSLTKYDQSTYIWIWHYTKFSWISSAVIYKCTGLVETGKLINQLIAWATFFTAWHVLAFFVRGKGWRILLAALIALNPVLLAQLFTDYVDGIMGNMLILVLLLLLALELETAGYRRLLWFMLGSCIIIASNLKFTGIALSAVLIGVSAVYWLFKHRPLKLLFQKAALLAIFYLLAFFFYGFNPYLTNYQAKRFPFYPVNDPQLYAVIMNSVPKLIKAKTNRVEKLGLSLLSECNNDANDTQWHWKYPFVVHKSEVLLFSTTDVRLSGLGPLFQLILWLTLILLVYSLVKYRGHPHFDLVLTAIICILGTTLIFPESWWARYFPILYLLPLLVLLPGGNRPSMPILSRIIILVLCINFALIGAAGFGAAIVKTRIIRSEMASLKNKPVYIDFNGSYFQATRQRLKEAGVSFIETDTLTGDIKELHTLYKLEGFGPKYSLTAPSVTNDNKH